MFGDAGLVCAAAFQLLNVPGILSKPEAISDVSVCVLQCTLHSTVLENTASSHYLSIWFVSGITAL